MAERWIIQFCHCHYGPFADVARQYAALFHAKPYKVLTVYLTGQANEAIATKSASDEVIFLDFSSRAVAGLKLGAIRAFRRIVASRDVALIIAHRTKPIQIACLATRLPIIGVHHAFGDYRRASRRWFINAFRHRLALLGVSDAVRDDIRASLAWPPERIETLHNRLDVTAAHQALCSRQESREVLGLPANIPVIGNVGRLHADKDQATLIAAFARALPELPEGSLLAIAGSGPLDDQLRHQAAALGIADRVRLLGQVAGVSRLFRAFDLFVLSSDHEPFGMVLLEAMVADVPILATDCGGAPEVLDDASKLFPLGDSKTLAQRMITSLTNSDPHVSGQNRLHEHFSDEAARRRFFALPMVEQVLTT